MANYSEVTPAKINSRDNSLLRRARAVRDGKSGETIFVEGLRLCEEALLSGLRVEAAIYSEEIARKERAAQLIEQLQSRGEKIVAVSEKLLESISFTKTPQGIVVLATRPTSDEYAFKQTQSTSPFLVVLHGLNNPVNVGAILRTAEAAGITGVIATVQTADPFSPKSLRGSMGSAFRLPIWIGARFDDVLEWCKAARIHTLAAAARAAKDYTEIEWSQPYALIVGPESTGLSPEETAQTDDAIRIPMAGAVESLNVAVAAGVILFEAKRQRNAHA